jgi:hypothetical protein
MNIGSASIFAVDASSRIKEELVTYLKADIQGKESRKRSSTRTGWPLTTFSSAAILLDAVINRGVVKSTKGISYLTNTRRTPKAEVLLSEFVVTRRGFCDIPKPLAATAFGGRAL